MTVDELIDRLTEVPGYRDVMVNGYPLVEIAERPTAVDLLA